MQYPDYSDLWFHEVANQQYAPVLGRGVVMGRFEDQDLTWTVISVNHDFALLLCDRIVAAMPASEGGVDVRTWLNVEFPRETFDIVERVDIQPAFLDRSPNPDVVVNLSVREVEAYLPVELRACMGTSWWLRDFKHYVDEQGKICESSTPQAFRGLRPVITVRMQ